MDAGKRTISDIFNGNRKLVIPFFQRTYVWKEEQWSRLIEDMEYISSTDKDYFLGSIILKSQPTSSDSSVGDIRTIIDGQQRLTTLSIFLKVLALKTGNKKIAERLFTLNDDSLAMQHSQGDAEPFEKIMYLDELKEIESGQSNILKAYNYFKSNIEPTRLNIQRIQNKAQFVGIDLQFNEDEQQIFDTINSLGVKLTTGELLKNHFFNKDSVNQYNKYWKPVFDEDDECREFWDQEVTAGRLKRNNIEAFLSAFLQIRVQEPSLNVKAEDKALYRRSDGLFNSYKKFISDYIINGITDEHEKDAAILSFIADLTEYAKVYKSSFNISRLKSEVGSNPGIDRMNIIIYALEGTTAIPYLMYVERNVLDKDEKLGIYTYLEAYLMRRVICRSSSKSYSDLFNENLIGNSILTGEALKAYIDSKDADADLAMPSNVLLRKAIHDFVFPNKRAMGIIYMLESRLRKPELHATAMLGFSSYSLEHLMPKKWRKNWNTAVDPDFRDYTLLTLGNLAIITSALNTKISNAEWQKKLTGNNGNNGLKGYASGLVTMEDVLTSDMWDEDSISDRADWLADRAIEVWPSYYDGGEELEDESDDISTKTSPDAVSSSSAGRNMSKIDRTTFSLNGSEYLKKGAFVRLVIKEYIAKYPSITFAELKKVFSDSLLESGYKFKGLLLPIDEWNSWQYDAKMRRYSVTAPDSILTSSDNVRFYVNNQWTLPSVKKIVEIAEREGFTVDTK